MANIGQRIKSLEKRARQLPINNTLFRLDRFQRQALVENLFDELLAEERGASKSRSVRSMVMSDQLSDGDRYAVLKATRGLGKLVGNAIFHQYGDELKAAGVPEELRW